ncbi:MULTISPECIES: hypothetical protein [unclassified Thiocapsa]|uniref:hypothetical protein n=1 Tax=unclassified Thiocapsa TaxID=2641286 RepID=UPI0035AE942D
MCKTQAGVNAAHRQVAIVAVYAKLQGVEWATARALVGDSAGGAGGDPRHDGSAAVSTALASLKYPNGNCSAGGEHRLKPVRKTVAGPLLGASLVVVEPKPEIAAAVVIRADGHPKGARAWAR